MKKCLFLLFLVISINSFSQKATIHGYVEDANSGEKLIGANVFDKNTLKGTSANVYGFYSLTLPSDSILLIASFIGYKAELVRLKLVKDTVIHFKLFPAADLKAVEVVADNTEKIFERSRMSTIEIPIEQIKNLPVLFGERDVLKIVQLLPGVQAGSEGNSGFYVRGGGADQNLILLDGVPVYNASHLFGFFSVFNPDAINSVELVKGGFPARYGGRLSSVLDIRMKEGDANKFHGEGTIGLIASKLTLEGPIIKNKSSFIVSGRRTYIDILARPIIKAAARSGGAEATAGYYFYDLNSKVNYSFNENNRLFLSSYMGKDRAYARFKDTYVSGVEKHEDKSDVGLQWGNITTALRWNRIITNKLFANTTLTFSRYQFDVGQKFEAKNVTKNKSELFKFNYISGIQDLGGKIDFDYMPSPRHYVKFGIGNTYHTFIPGVNAYKSSTTGTAGIDTSFGAASIYAHEYVVYAEDDINLTSRLKVNAGLHYSGFIVKKKTYQSLQPRISARYILTENTSVKASYTTMAQYLHLLTNATIGLPTDLWVPVTDTIKPQLSQQFAAGLARTVYSDYEISVEGYYKTLENLIEYKEGASFFSSSTDWQQKVEFGRGWGYGAEVLLQKKKGKFMGWIGYTLSWSHRQFDQLNFGEKFFYKYDRRHDVGLALTYKLSDRTDFGLVWVYGTGNALTLGTERYYSNPQANEGYGSGNSLSSGNGGYEIESYDERNSFRMPAYHRLDLGINRHKQKKYGQRTWSFGVYNAYNNRNPFYLYFGNKPNGDRALKQISLFPLLPSVSYSFKF